MTAAERVKAKGLFHSELSATRPGMEGIRQEGQTMSEEDRTHARSIAKWVVGIPFAVGGTILAWSFTSRFLRKEEEH